MGVNVEGNLPAFRRESGKTGNADRNLIADAGGFQNQVRRMFLQNASAKVGDNCSRNLAPRNQQGWDANAGGRMGSASREWPIVNCRLLIQSRSKSRSGLPVSGVSLARLTAS